MDYSDLINSQDPERKPNGEPLKPRRRPVNPNQLALFTKGCYFAYRKKQRAAKRCVTILGAIIATLFPLGLGVGTAFADATTDCTSALATFPFNWASTNNHASDLTVTSGSSDMYLVNVTGHTTTGTVGSGNTTLIGGYYLIFGSKSSSGSLSSNLTLSTSAQTLVDTIGSTVSNYSAMYETYNTSTASFGIPNTYQFSGSAGTGTINYTLGCASIWRNQFSTSASKTLTNLPYANPYVVLAADVTPQTYGVASSGSGGGSSTVDFTGLETFIHGEIVDVCAGGIALLIASWTISQFKFRGEK